MRHTFDSYYQCGGSVTFGTDPSADPCLSPIDQDPYPDAAIFVLDLQDANKKLFFPQFFYLFLFEGTFTSSF